MVILSSHSMCDGKPDSTEATGGNGRQGLIKEVWLCLAVGQLTALLCTRTLLLTRLLCTSQALFLQTTIPPGLLFSRDLWKGSSLNPECWHRCEWKPQCTVPHSAGTGSYSWWSWCKAASSRVTSEAPHNRSSFESPSVEDCLFVFTFSFKLLVLNAV